MQRSLVARFVALFIGAFFLMTSSASAAPSAALTKRAGELVGLFNGTAKPADMFAPAFLAQVPEAQLSAVSRQLTGQLGAARSVAKIDAKSDTSATVFVEFERGTVQLEMALEPAAPNLIIGLLVTGTEVKGDSLAAILKEMQALPGQASLAVAKLGGAVPEFTPSHRADQPMAIGSAFKLFLLAEISRQVEAGERRWSDVVPLDRRSLPSGFLQSWPEGAPITLHSLAALMISQSDNTATDVLLHALGREKVEAILPALGVKAANRNRPFLSTLEAFALKADGDAEFSRDWAARSEEQRRALLKARNAMKPEAVALAKFAGKPTRIDSVEWFASAEDLVRTMDWLRKNGDKQTLDILAINPGIGAAAQQQFGYLGFKGGSEAGVINLTFLLRTKAGAWHAVSGSWNNPAAPVDETTFVALMSRAVNLLR